MEFDDIPGLIDRRGNTALLERPRPPRAPRGVARPTDVPMTMPVSMPPVPQRAPRVRRPVVRPEPLIRTSDIEDGELTPVWMVKVGLVILLGVLVLAAVELLIPAVMAAVPTVAKVLSVVVIAVAGGSYWQDRRSRSTGE